MTSEDDNKPLHKQFLRVQREEEEDTWISGEELKTEGSSGSDDEVPRRKITQRKSRRRRSEGYTPPESRLSLPNLVDNKAGISFLLSQADEQSTKGERFSMGGGLCEVREEKFQIDSAMARMTTRASLDRTDEGVDLGRGESEWRPKRGSLKLPNLEEAREKKKNIRFSDNVEQIEPPKNPTTRRGFNNSKFDVCSEEDMGMDSDLLDTLGEDFDKWKESSMGFSDAHSSDAFDDDDIDRYVLKNPDVGEWKPILNKKLNLPDIDGGNTDLSVKQFVSEMNDFYNEMSGKLKSLKHCPVLENSQSGPLDSEDESFMQKENFKNLYKNLKKTPQVKKTLSLISKMDSDISDTISKFREERAERLEIQKRLMKNIPRDKNSQLFLQLCEFESKTSGSLKNESKHKKGEKNETRRKSRRNFEDTNFIERNIELAKIGMNFSLSDEQKQRLEKILTDELGDVPVGDGDRLPSGVRRVNQMPEFNDPEDIENEVYTNCTMNAYRLSDEHKGRLIEIDSALKDFEEVDSKQSSESNIRVGLVRSLKEIDEKLKVLSASYIQDEELLKKNKRKPIVIEYDRKEQDEHQNLGNKPSTESTISTESSISI